MAKSVARLSVSLRANTKQFQKGMRNAQKTLKQFSRSIADVAIRTTKFAAVLGGAVAAAVTLFTKQALTNIDVLAKTADKLGVNIGQLQAYRLAAKQAGVEQRSFDTGIQRLLRRFGEFEVGSGEAKAALKELGVEAKSFSKLDLDGKIRKLSEAFEGVESPTQKLRLAFKLFDTEGVALVNLLNVGSAGLDKMMARIQQLGGVMTRVQAAMVENANNALSETAFAFRRIFENFAVAVSPIVETLANEMSNVASSAKITDLTFQAFFTNIAIGAGKAVDFFRRMRIEIKLIQLAVVTEFATILNAVSKSLIVLLPLRTVAVSIFGKDLPGVGAISNIAKVTKELIADIASEVDQMTQALDVTPTSLKFLRGIENVFKRAKEAAGSGVSALGAFGDILKTPDANKNQFRQVSISRFGVLPGATKAKPQIVSDPEAIAALARINESIRQQFAFGILQ